MTDLNLTGFVTATAAKAGSTLVAWFWAHPFIVVGLGAVIILGAWMIFSLWFDAKEGHIREALFSRLVIAVICTAAFFLLFALDKIVSLV